MPCGANPLKTVATAIGRRAKAALMPQGPGVGPWPCRQTVPGARPHIPSGHTGMEIDHFPRGIPLISMAPVT